MRPDAMTLIFWMLSFKPTFSLSSFTFIIRLFSSLLFAIKVVSSAYLRLLIFLPAILIPACALSSLAKKWRRTKEPLDESGREEWKSWLKTQHSKSKIMASGPITSWQINGETLKTVTDFIFLGSNINAGGAWSNEIKRCLFLGRKAMTSLVY